MICCDTYCMVTPYSWTQEAYDTVASYLKYDMLWYVLHGTTVFMDLGCVWYGAIVFKIWYVVIRITWYHRIPGLMMRMIRCHRIYNMICCDAYYMVPSYSWTEDAYDTVALYIKYDMLRYVLHATTVFMNLGCVWYSGIVYKIWYVVIRITWYHRMHGLRMRMKRCHRI